MLSSQASDSRRLEGQVQECRFGFAVLQPIRDHPERQRLDPGNGVRPGHAVAHHAGEGRHLRQPTTIVFAVELDAECHEYSR